MKYLKIWNGRYGRSKHVYVAAYSYPDLQKLFIEHGLIPPTRSEVKGYWSANCWGTPMSGIEVQRGIWIQDNWNGPVKRVPLTS